MKILYIYKLKNLPFYPAGIRCGRAAYLSRINLHLLIFLVSLSATARQLTAISGLKRGNDGRVTLEISSSGDPGEFVDVFYSDELTNAEWKMGGKYLRAQGEPKIMWSESEDSFSPPQTGRRFFRIGRADIDLNDNGIPDAREALIHMHDLEPEKRARWAQAGLGGAIPDYSTIVNVRDYGAKGNGTTDDTSAIRNAISAAPAQSVVYLPAGTYLLTKSLYLESDMILRGDGSALTSLIFQGIGTDDRCIGISRWNGEQNTDYVTVTDGMNFGSTEITVSSVSGFEVGDIIEMDQENDPAWGLSDSWQSRLVCQINRITDIDVTNKRITLDHNLRYKYTAIRNPRMRKLAVIKNSGVENLYVRRQDKIDGYTIELKYAVGCWVKSVESYMTYKAHVWMERSFECEVRQSYFHDGFVFGSGGQGYGVCCGKATSDCLVEDNVFRHLRHSMIVGIGANGNVYGYNFSIQRATDPVYGTQQPDISVHGNYVYMNLFEGNVLEDADVPDWYEPAGPGNTLFRNRIVNSGTAIEVASDNQNFIGNVLTQGILERSQPVVGIIEYANVEQGNLELFSANQSTSEGNGWPGCPCNTLIDSLYRSVPPEFILNSENVSWPAVGPDLSLSSETPAQQRFDNGIYVSD